MRRCPYQSGADPENRKGRTQEAGKLHSRVKPCLFLDPLLLVVNCIPFHFKCMYI